MFLSQVRLGWALAVVVVVAGALIPAAGATAGGIQPTSPWYAYDAAVTKAQHQRQQHAVSVIQPTSPWYAYDAAVLKARQQRQQHVVSGIQPTSPWYAYDAAVTKARHHRVIAVLQDQRVG